MIPVVAFFGAAEKGDFKNGLYCQTLTDLYEHFGEPPDDTQGLHLAIQALLYNHRVIFFRVREEGFSRADYLRGLNILENVEHTKNLAAICLPGVGDSEIIDATASVCSSYHTLLIVTQKDLYDYLTYRP